MKVSTTCSGQMVRGIPGGRQIPSLTHNMHATVKHGGGKVLVWGCMAGAGVGKLVFIDQIMNANVYINVLRHNLKASAAQLNMEKSFVFQQDNDPKHTAWKNERMVVI